MQPTIKLIDCNIIFRINYGAKISITYGFKYFRRETDAYALKHFQMMPKCMH